MKTIILALLFILLNQSAFAKPDGVVVLAGGGEEGKPGDKSAWNYDLFNRLVKNGDTNGDRKVKVVVLSYYKGDDSYKKYFRALGADAVEDVPVLSRKAASDPKILKQIKEADVVFFRGGDQAEYYKNIKNTKLKAELDGLRERGGAFGGTSAGAMSLAGLALAGGQELGSDDTLSDGHSPLLNDAYNKKKSSIKDDFLGMVPNTIVDTHCGERARLGRILGVHAKASQDFGRSDILGICVSEQTGVAISKGKAEVYGNGVVEFIKQTPDSKIQRIQGQPLIYTDVALDALTEGWVFDMATQKPDLSSLPSGAKLISGKMKCGAVVEGSKIDGANADQSSAFELYPIVADQAYSLAQSKDPKVTGVIGITKSQSYDKDKKGNTIKALSEAAVYRSLHDHPKRTAILLSDNSELVAYNSNQIGFENPNPKSKTGETSTIILDCAHCSHTSLSPRITELDNGSKTLRLAGFVNMRVHAIGASKKSGVSYNLRSHSVESQTSVTEGSTCIECEAKTAQVKDSTKAAAEQALASVAECE